MRTLTDWLQRVALKNEHNDGSRTFVVCDGQAVVGYYTLATGAIQRAEAPGKVRRNMPEPVPMLVLGRLSVDNRYHGKGIGRGMLRDAVLRVVGASEQVGIKAVLVHALSEDARRFYERHGFQVSPADDMTLMVTLKDARALMGG
ncbi:GNAT family N-acetyltransferase [Thiohalorhabdus sp.]|uniref:GNAT family N-acetyltransferase n=1 Tax=Thiohalorhabdus sp. TaxID=3094134 RepID=UPI002FC33B2F